MGPETGLCKALFYRYYYNSETCECDKFIYGGCGGNANNFDSLSDCEAAGEECACTPEPTEICCDPDDPVLTQIGGRCREGCACCPDGEWVGSFGDAKTFACGNDTLVKGEDDDKFGDICDTEAPTTTDDGFCICAAIYDPVCCDGVTYPNECSADCRCDGDIVDGVCDEPTTTVDDSCVCIAQYDPVCCDGVTYSNECVAKCRCDGDIVDGVCATEEPSTTEGKNTFVFSFCLRNVTEN